MTFLSWVWDFIYFAMEESKISNNEKKQQPLLLWKRTNELSTVFQRYLHRFEAIKWKIKMATGYNK